MAGSVNKVTLIGNLGKDPEIRNTQAGTKICNLTIATSETWNDRTSGERKERTEWHRVVIFNERLADVAERFLRKGRKVYLEGALETRKYTDQSGQEKYTTEVVLRNFRGELVLLDSNRGEEGGYSGGAEGGSTPAGGGYVPRERAASGPARPSGGAGRSGGAGGPSWDAPKGGDLDDEIPF
jgi:single-strand DNA-binding protein